MKFNPFSPKDFNKEPEEEPKLKPANLTIEASEVENMRNVIVLAGKMRSLLEQCRYESLPMNLAKRIDVILREAQEFD